MELASTSVDLGYILVLPKAFQIALVCLPGTPVVGAGALEWEVVTRLKPERYFARLQPRWRDCLRRYFFGSCKRLPEELW